MRGGHLRKSINGEKGIVGIVLETIFIVRWEIPRRKLP
jgi:hypothetical protein